jgi:hypothetical protein
MCNSNSEHQFQRVSMSPREPHVWLTVQVSFFFFFLSNVIEKIKNTENTHSLIYMLDEENRTYAQFSRK